MDAPPPQTPEERLVRLETLQENVATKAELERVEKRLIIWTVSAVALGTSIIGVLLRFWA